MPSPTSPIASSPQGNQIALWAPFGSEPAAGIAMAIAATAPTAIRIGSITRSGGGGFFAGPLTPAILRLIGSGGEDRLYRRRPGRACTSASW